MEHPWSLQGGISMDAAKTEVMIVEFLKDIRSRLDEAASVATAAEACAGAGNVRKAIEIALDVEQPLYEVTTLLNVASLINRLRDT
jgi:hypothetical protein